MRLRSYAPNFLSLPALAKASDMSSASPFTGSPARPSSMTNIILESFFRISFFMSFCMTDILSQEGRSFQGNTSAERVASFLAEGQTRGRAHNALSAFFRTISACLWYIL
jgi:hypothetical protein